MQVEREWLRRVVFGRQSSRRFTQESPILPDVWMVGASDLPQSKRRIDFCSHPIATIPPAPWAPPCKAVSGPQPKNPGGAGRRRQRTADHPRGLDAGVSQVAVAVSLTLEELITAALPLTPWWKRNLPSIHTLLDGADGNAEVRWMYQIVGTLVLCSMEPSSERERSPENLWFGDDRSDALRTTTATTMTRCWPIRQSAPRATNADYERFRQIVRDHEGQRGNSNGWRAGRPALQGRGGPRNERHDTGR